MKKFASTSLFLVLFLGVIFGFTGSISKVKHNPGAPTTGGTVGTIYIDGFDDYGANSASVTAAVGAPWTTSALVTNFPRNGAYALGLTTSALTATSTFNLSSVGSTGCIGMGLYFNGQPNTTYQLIALYDSTSTITNYLSFNSSTGAFSINGGSTLCTYVPTSITWFYVEYVYNLSTSGTGTASIWVNGSQLYSGTSLTNATHNANWQGKIVIGAAASYQNVDDFYCTYGNRLGPIQVVTLLPNANSSTNTAWTASSGSAYTDVNSIPPGSNYISDGVVNDTSTFTSAGTFPSTGAVLAVYVKANATLDSAGLRGLGPTVRTHSTNYASTGQSVALTTYTGFFFGWDLNPNTGLQWTNAELNAAEFGVQTTS